MKSFKINRFVIVVFLLFLACSVIATQSIPIRLSRILFIYVDEESRIYWNVGNPADSLPYLLPSDSNILDSLDYKIDMRGLYDLLLEKNRVVKKINNIILICPDAHYSSLDRILMAIHWVEWVWNDKTAYKLGISANELDREHKFICRYSIGDWGKRASRILEAVWKKRNITPSGQTKIPIEQTYEFKMKNGYWDDEIADKQLFSWPISIKPKVGIPKPVVDDEIIDDDVMIASRDNLAEIIARKEKETTTDKLEPMNMCKVLQIYIDSNNRIFWNVCNPGDSLPKQLPIIKFPSDTTDCEINIIYFEHLIKGLKNKNRTLFTLIYAHPNSHYSCFDKVINEIYKFEKDRMAQSPKKDDNYSKQNLQNKFPLPNKIKPKISVARPERNIFATHGWTDRNDRIINAVYNFSGLDSSDKIVNAVEDQFSERINNGYWDKDVINYDPSPGVPISRKPVDSALLKKHIARTMEPDTHKPSEYLPTADEFVPVEISAEQIYYHAPEYPRLAENAGIEAIVWVKTLVDNEGRVRDAMILKSSGSKAGFDEASLYAAYKCRYKPAIQNGRPVAVWHSYEVKFAIPPDSQSQK